MFTPFHKPPYTYPYGRSVNETTTIENIVAAKELLENNQSPAALEMAVKLMTKALVQQEKATSSRKLESDDALCRSSTASKARVTETMVLALITNLIPDP
jgi:hypothetical protein